jgi:hypothetical protein
MSLSDLAAVGSFVSGIAVLISLIYLAYQVRQSMHATRSQIHQNVLSGWQGVAALVSHNAQAFAVGLASTEASFSAMSDADKLTYLAVIYAFFKHYENSYLQYQEGLIRKEDWAAWANHIFMYWRMPGVQHWWKLRRDTFSPAFVHFLETSNESFMPSTTEIIARASVVA